MNTFNKIRNAAFIFTMGALVLTSCTKDDVKPTETPGNTTEVKSGILTANETWTPAKIYTLSGLVVVSDGVELTIEPGTIIKAEGGQQSAASALIIAKGGKINAVGTESSPIIFTSIADNIALGQTEGTNLERNDNQLWGGIIILGKAPISAENGDTGANIEGINAELGFGAYGGTVANDNSGNLSYVSIRHGGISIGDGNEINGLTLGGVGSGTVISNIEIYATLDDGIEFFGGTVNVDKALVYYQGDDGLDIDQNYSGTISNFAVIHGDGIGTDESLEIDGPEGSTYSEGMFKLMNGICIIEGNDGSPGDFKSKAQGVIENVTFQSSKDIKFRTKFDESCGTKSDAYSHLISNPATLSFIECKMAGVKVYDGNADDSNPTTCPTELAANTATAADLVTFNGTGSSINVQSTFSWTCASKRGQL